MVDSSKPNTVGKGVECAYITIWCPTELNVWKYEHPVLTVYKENKEKHNRFISNLLQLIILWIILIALNTM